MPSNAPKTVKPTVITSKAAKDDLENIRMAHQNIVQGIANQSLRVQAHREQRAAQLQNEQNMRAEIQKNQMAATTEAQKVHNDFALKQGELDIKRAALNLK